MGILTPPALRTESYPQIDPEEMSFAMHLYQFASRMVMPMPNVETGGIEAGDAAIAKMMLDSLPEGLNKMYVVRGTRLAPKDNNINRGMNAVAKHYIRDVKHPQFEAIIARLSAFVFLYNDLGEGGLREWTRPSKERPEAVELHPAVIDAIGSAPTDKWGQFDRKTFFETTKKIAAEKYADY